MDGHLPKLDVAISTGLRKGNQYALRWDMVDWKSRELHIPNTETKNGKPLHVLLNDAAIAVLKVAFEAGGGKGRVFKSKKAGDPLENGRHWFDDAIVLAKLKNFHGTICGICSRAVCG
jgi:integrase